MTEPEGGNGGRLDVATLEEALSWMRSDARTLLRDMLRGISMWGFTALLAALLAALCLVLAQSIMTFEHPYGSPPEILDALYVSYGVAAVSAVSSLALAWRYFSLRRRYTKLFEIAAKLR